ncbi:Origin recognition complex subunit 3 [Diaporthe australafricana]|uniref:Origin recognition complex subunit 3 n=1 Tax=Diaporthe australafricana TaxID=127596 RepID=A0ABR3X3W5_9PEZI
MDHDGEAHISDDHRAAFIFGQDDETDRVSHPAKRRKVSGKAAPVNSKPGVRPQIVSEFVPLLHGVEKPEFVSSRQALFADAWTAIDARIQHVLKESNRSTLDAVASFVGEAPVEAHSKIPAALIVTGPNISSQDLLFEQLAEGLGESVNGAIVRLRSAEVPNLKATLKKMIRDVTRRSSEHMGDDAELSVGMDGRKYLDYDLEALHAHVEQHGAKQVIVAFQDSEAFDTGLLSDLITLFNSWKDRIPFTLLFGIATSVELFQVRLPKSTSQHLYGAQFDVVQMSSVLENMFKAAVAHGANPLIIGPGLLRELIERQQSQVAGIQSFMYSLKYAYMCHFYSNPLSVLLSEVKPQPEHLEALRNLPSFRSHIEDALEAGRLKHVRSLLDDDDYLVHEQQRTVVKVTAKWQTQLLRSLSLLEASELLQETFITTYTNALGDGIDLHSEGWCVLDAVKKKSPDDVSSLLHRLLDTVRSGNRELGMLGWATEDKEFVRTLSDMLERLASLQSQSQLTGKPLRSQYSAQTRLLRTTVVAQKVQLSQAETSLSNEDKAFTTLIDDLVGSLAAGISCQPADAILFHELWMYESASPHKNVFIPRPGIIFERALSRPHDYLACACCGEAKGSNTSTLPATSILFHLYGEAGALVNVADLWSAFHTLVGCGDDEEDEPKSKHKSKSAKSGSEDGVDERTALVLFYQGLAELKAMGFVKPTKKKADHIARLKWL